MKKKIQRNFKWKIVTVQIHWNYGQKYHYFFGVLYSVYGSTTLTYIYNLFRTPVIVFERTSFMEMDTFQIYSVLECGCVCLHHTAWTCALEIYEEKCHSYIYYPNVHHLQTMERHLDSSIISCNFKTSLRDFKRIYKRSAHLKRTNHNRYA